MKLQSKCKIVGEGVSVSEGPGAQGPVTQQLADVLVSSYRRLNLITGKCSTGPIPTGKWPRRADDNRDVQTDGQTGTQTSLYGKLTTRRINVLKTRDCRLAIVLHSWTDKGGGSCQIQS